MRFQKFFRKSLGVVFSVLLVFSATLLAQDRRDKPTLVIPRQPAVMPIAAGNNLYCAGFVQTSPVNTANKIVGAENEQEQLIYAQGDNLYINMGSNKGVQVGDIFAIIRPRGQVDTRWTNKGRLGFYVEEVGALEVVRVKNEVSVARVTTSCSAIQLGDLLQQVPQRTSPNFVGRPALDVFGEPTGKARGRIFMARDGRELLGREQIVYIDLGADDNVRVGDYLTIFRRLGKGKVFESDLDETVDARDEGFQSEAFRGGKFSNQAPRKSGSEARGKVVTIEEAKEDRPRDLRKVLGEMVILNVKERTATAIIVRAEQEIHTGDWVELQ